MRYTIVLFSVCFANACGGSSPAATADATPQAPDAALSRCETTPTGRVVLPTDDELHHDETEWWYWTGHLQTAAGDWFGFEQAIFLQQSPLGGGRVRMGHHAITDQSAGVFVHDEQFANGEPPAVAGGFDLAVGPHTAVGGGGNDVLHGEVGDYVLDVQLSALKPPVLQHHDGYTDYEFGGNTYYYSRERMSATGSITIGGETQTVSGTAWFDHQWGALTTAVDAGWDWFALQLDDDREMMLFIVRVADSDVLVGGSFTDSSCATTDIGPGDYQVTSLGTWTSPLGCTYPMGWDISLNDGLTLTVTPVMENQELDNAFIDYWEGMAEVSGDATGRAYVELTGYCN